MIRKKIETHNDGVVNIYHVGNIAEPPLLPKDGLTFKEQLRYKSKTIGMQRYYTALQSNVRVSHVLRTPNRANVSTQDIAILSDGKQYSIVQVQRPDSIHPPVMDLTLEALEQDYEIA